MEILTFLIILAFVIIGLKLLGFVFKTGLFLLSIPLQILAAVIVSVVLLVILPIGLLTGFVALLLAPLGILAPLLPFILIFLGIYWLAHK